MRGRPLGQGHSGAAVQELKGRLRGEGYILGDNDVFDRETYLVLRDYQGKHDCEIDGVAGPETLSTLGFPVHQSILERVTATRARRHARQLVGTVSRPGGTGLPAPAPPSAPPGATPSARDFVNPSGRGFLQGLAARGIDAVPLREEAVLAEVNAGHVPSWISDKSRWIEVPIQSADGKLRGRIRVAPDYFSVGRSGDSVRMPIRPATAQDIADRFDGNGLGTEPSGHGAMLPTSRMVDAIHANQSTLHLTPQPTPSKPPGAMESSRRFLEHDDLVQRQLDGRADGTSRPLVDGQKKDLVVSNRYRPGHVTIYGWYYPQPTRVPNRDGNGTHLASRVEEVPHSAHLAAWVDYSHGTRFVDSMMYVEGRGPMRVAQVLADPELAPLVSDEGVITRPRVD